MNYIIEAALEGLTWIACTIIALCIFFLTFHHDGTRTCTYSINEAGSNVSVCR